NRRRTDYLCRSIYLPVIRNDLPEIFEAFDFADPHVVTGARTQTLDATQGLYLMNDRMVVEAAEAAAKRILGEDVPGGDRGRIDWLFVSMFGVPATDEECEEILAFIRETGNRGSAEGREQAWASACHAMLSMSRFQFLD
ncbi:MAG: DUF1553 domain-containing protein, partial [Akkermansiaceae bacterium]|nr:DUF1553 domain-containing protein [Akkermansiaceae bacterium]